MAAFNEVGCTGWGRVDFMTGEDGNPPIGIGRECTIRNAILDLDARIGNGVQLVNEGGLDEVDAENYAIRGGVIVVPRGAAIPDGTII